MALLKSIEIAFRSFLIRALRLVVRRGGSPPKDFEFNNASILFIRQDRIGDVLVSTPVFRAIKKRYPNAHLDVFLSPNNVVALANNPDIRTRWIYQKRPLRDLGLLGRIRSQRYDFVVDLMDNPSATSTVITLLAGARWTVGLDKENAYSYDIVVPLLSRRDVHIVDRVAQLLTVFGIEPDPTQQRIVYHPSEENEARVNSSLRSDGKKGGLRIGVNISAGHDTRFWGVEHYRQLLSRIIERESQCTVYVFSKESDRERTLEIAAAEPGIRAPETKSFDAFAAYIKRMDVLITPDTAAVHLAAAYHVPAVVLYVQSDKNLRIWDPYRSPAECVVTDHNDLSKIDVDHVFDAYVRIRRSASGDPGQQ